MEIIFIIGLLILLAVISLVIGVSNDAANFLRSAIGAQITKKRIIYWVAAVGLILGSFFSYGMITNGQSQIVNTWQLTLSEMIAVFFAVIITCIVIIHLCNVYGLPTSTTTAFVFSISGGVLAIGTLQSFNSDSVHLGDYIATEKIFIILAGIFISVFFAFVSGLIVQFISRLVFSFKSRKTSGLLFSLAGSIAITVIFFFIFKKVLIVQELEGNETILFFAAHLPEMLTAIFAFTLFVFGLGGSLFRINIPMIVVLFGTFALALSFAANDLINFIGIPLLGIQNLLINNGIVNWGNFWSLGNDVSMMNSQIYYLVIPLVVSVVMIATLFYSRKISTVVETELMLERQSAGKEQFESTHLSRSIVKIILQIIHNTHKILPNWLIKSVSKQYEPIAYTSNVRHAANPSFDSIRASVNVVLAALIIMTGTFFKLPLSTTFIVFLVGVGSAIGDNAWTRENAVYRLSGVFTILGIWLFASLLAFIGAFFLTIVIVYGKLYAIIGLLIIMMLTIFRMDKVFKQHRINKKALDNESYIAAETKVGWLVDNGLTQFKKQLIETLKIVVLTFHGFMDEDLGQLRESSHKVKLLIKSNRANKQELFEYLKQMPDQWLEAGYNLVQAFDYMSEISESLHSLIAPVLLHVENNHKGLNDDQYKELSLLLDETISYFNFLIHLEKEQSFSILNDPQNKQRAILNLLERYQKFQIKRIKTGSSNTKASSLYLDLLSETKNVLLYSINLVKSQRDFMANLKGYHKK